MHALHIAFIMRRLGCKVKRKQAATVLHKLLPLSRWQAEACWHFEQITVHHEYLECCKWLRQTLSRNGEKSALLTSESTFALLGLYKCSPRCFVWPRETHHDFLCCPFRMSCRSWTYTNHRGRMVTYRASSLMTKAVICSRSQSQVCQSAVLYHDCSSSVPPLQFATQYWSQLPYSGTWLDPSIRGQTWSTASSMNNLE